MKTSQDRILTTHVGSLPRSAAVVALLYKKENHEPFDEGEFDSTMASGVDAVVAKQVGAGIDVVSDGETGKVGYATYIKDRLSGFEGTLPHGLPPRSRAVSGISRGHVANDRRTDVSSASPFVGPIPAHQPRSDGSKNVAHLRAAADRHEHARRFHQCRVARSRLVIPVESLLPDDMTGYCRRNRRSNARGIRNN